MNIREHKKIMSSIIFFTGIILFCLSIFYSIFISTFNGIILFIYSLILFCLAEIVFYLSFISEQINEKNKKE